VQAAAIVLSSVRTESDPFESIMRAHETRVLRTALRILGNRADAEDVAQETFLRLHRRGIEFESEAGLSAWLYRVAVNLCLDRTRARRPSTELRDLKSPGISAESAAIRRQSRDLLLAALEELPARERAAVVLREIEGLATPEVAQILGVAEATVRSQISKAVSKLRERLAREEV
jgi:RNA polymerase sigma-70 factor (ECF subfamily)